MGAVSKIGVYEPASGDNGAGRKQETLGIQKNQRVIDAYLGVSEDV